MCAGDFAHIGLQFNQMSFWVIYVAFGIFAPKVLPERDERVQNGLMLEIMVVYCFLRNRREFHDPI
jgi:hypothetical protein